jgi:hypothetical protein
MVSAPEVLPPTVTEHTPPADRVQVVELNETAPVPACVHVIVSPVTVPANPLRVAVHVVPEHTTAVAVIDLTVIEAVPVSARLLASPGYDAWIVTVPLVAPVTLMEQLVPEIVQVAGVGKVTLPVPPVCEKVMVSPLIVPLAPLTVAVQLEALPTEMVVGVHATLTVGTALTVSAKLPVAATLATSPEYEAWTVADPAVCPVMVIEQVPAPDRVHVAGVGKVTLPVPAVWLHVIVSPLTVPENPVRVAVHEDVEPTPTVAGVHEAVRVGVPMVSDADPMLARLFVSPGYDAWRVTDPAVEPLTVIEHVPAPLSAQVPELRLTLPEPLCDQVMVSPVIEPV